MSDVAFSDVSVAVVSYGSAPQIARLLPSIARCLPGAEVVVADNSPAPIAIDPPPGLAVEVVHGHGNVGFGAANNLAAAAAHRPLLLLLNPDVVVERVDVVEFDRLRAAGALGLVGCTAVDRAGGRLQRSVGWRIELAQSALRNFVLPRAVGLPQRRTRDPAAAWLSGSALLTRRDELAAVGGFDERYFLYHEDRDLTRRYVLAGLPVRRSEAIVVDHDAGTGSRQRADQRLALGLLGLLQYTAVWEGPDAARRAARRTRLVLAAAATGHGALARVGLARRLAAEKAALARDVEAFLDRAAAGDLSWAGADGEFYPDARLALGP